MAYVKVTQAVIDRTAFNIHDMRRQAVSQLDPAPGGTIQPGMVFYDAFRRALEAAIWEDAEHLRGQVPDTWLEERERAGIKVIGSDGGLKLNGWLQTEPLHPIQGVKLLDDWTIHRGHVRPEDLHHFDAFVKLREQVQHTVAQYRTLESQIVAFLRSHSSLNKAFKEMPELEMYLDEVDLDRLKKRTHKRKGAPGRPDKPEVDRDTIAALGVAHRLNSARG